MNSLKYYPLTSVQQEIWLDQMLHADLPVYNIGGYLKIKGSVDRNRFEHAIRQLISENDALRIILHEELPVPIQEFRKKISAEIPFYDFSDHENASQKALELMQEEFRRLFQIYETPLFCFMLIKVSDDSYYWFQKYHHLIIDEWAVSLCIRRVDTRGGLANPPPDADSSSYTAFIHWQIPRPTRTAALIRRLSLMLAGDWQIPRPTRTAALIRRLSLILAEDWQIPRPTRTAALIRRLSLMPAGDWQIPRPTRTAALIRRLSGMTGSI